MSAIVKRLGGVSLEVNVSKREHAHLETFGDRVRAARRDRLLGQRELAELAGLHRVHLARIETGVQGRRPHRERVRKLAAALNVCPSWFANGTDLPAASQVNTTADA